MLYIFEFQFVLLKATLTRQKISDNILCEYPFLLSKYPHKLKGLKNYLFQLRILKGITKDFTSFIK